jgi:hypothetical protein
MRKCHLAIVATHWVVRRLPVSLACEFSYNTADPLAVTVIFDSEGEYPVQWVFGRDLLADGLTTRTGQGDVEVWPDLGEAERPLLWIRVGHDNHTALFAVPAQPVGQWLARCYAMVARGDEMAHVDWEELSYLLQ